MRLADVSLALPGFLLLCLHSYTSSPSMASSSTTPTAEHEEFVHHIAIKLSRELNTINPNDLLARRVIDIATSNTLPGFISGAPFSSRLV